MPQLFIATRKGVWIAQGDAARTTWTLSEPVFLGTQCHHVVLDPRDNRTLLAASRQWHLGPTVFRSLDGGKTWKEAGSPPRFPTGEPLGRAVDHVFWLTPGHASQPGVWYCGTSPKGLFRSDDGGDTWAPVSGYNDHPDYMAWSGGEKDQTPDGGKLHSIIVDAVDPARMYLSMSGGGTFESLDAGASWTPRNSGVELSYAPPKDDGSEYPFGHDPHCMVQHPGHPDRLWQQNHCGIYKLDRPATRWDRIGNNMPKDIGDIGFGIVPHPRDRNTAWVFPMDGGGNWPRTPIAGKPAMYVTRDAGASWTRQDQGLPTEQAWWTVKRQAMCADAGTPLGLYFGTTNGQLWSSLDEGASFQCIAPHLPHIYAVTAGELA